jgi:N-acetylglutamate synthase-like GNAT family acetyltransferase
MDQQVVKVTELNPFLEMEIHKLLELVGMSTPDLQKFELYVRLDTAGSVLGVACAGKFDKNCLLTLVAVDPEMQRHGIGSMLVNHVLSYCAGECDSVYLVTEEEEFFVRFGFMLISLDRLPEEILRYAGSEGFFRPGVVAMQLVMPGNWSRG